MLDLASWMDGYGNGKIFNCSFLSMEVEGGRGQHM